MLHNIVRGVGSLTKAQKMQPEYCLVVASFPKLCVGRAPISNRQQTHTTQSTSIETTSTVGRRLHEMWTYQVFDPYSAVDVHALPPTAGLHVRRRLFSTQSAWDEYFSCVRRILLVSKRDPGVERLVQFVILASVSNVNGECK